MRGRRVLVLFPSVEEAQSALESHHGKPIIPTVSLGTRTDLRWALIEEPAGHVWINVYFATCAAQGAEIKSIAKTLIEDINPHLVILAGIAGGARGRDFGLFDCVISDGLMYVLRKKETPERTLYRQRIESGTVGKEIASKNVGQRISERLKDVAAEAVASLSFDDLVEGVQKAGIDKSELSTALSEAKSHLERVTSKGLRVGNAVVFSEYINTQRRENPLVDLYSADFTLQANEMEAIYVLQAMQESNRGDVPLVIKAISDIPNFIRSERIKNIARDLAARALREFLGDPEVWNLIQNLPLHLPLRPRRTRTTTTPRSSVPNFLEIMLSADAPPPVDQINFITQSIANDERIAAPVADLLDHNLEFCPRCGGGTG